MFQEDLEIDHFPTVLFEKLFEFIRLKIIWTYFYDQNPKMFKNPQCQPTSS